MHKRLKRVIIIIPLLLALFCVYFWSLSLLSSPPTNLGVKNGRLASCPDSPNCVSSQSKDPRHAISPLQYQGDIKEAKETLKKVLALLPRNRIVTESEDYLHVEFTTLFFRFVDDVEFYFPPQEQIVHVRSASRIGHSDLGVNRKRIEQIRSKFQ